MQSDSSQTRHLNYLDFELEIGPGSGREYPVAVVRSPAGEVRETMRFPYDELALESHLKDLQIALLRSGGKRRRVLSPEEQTVQGFGRDLFNALLSGEVRSRYDVSLREAAQQGKGLRLKLRIQSPELAALPWEFLYDSRQAEYLCLSRNTPVVRYLELPQPTQPLAVTPPLRILGMVASPSDLPPLDIQREKQRIERATRDLRRRGLVDLKWLPGQAWRDLQRAMRRGPWHVFHFIGHGGFDHNADEGFIALADEENWTHRLSATQLGRLLADHRSLRLALLNACEGARGSKRDIFSGTAAILVRRGIPAVLAMQYEITDRAAIEFARAFYEALADEMPVDAAVTEARIAISLAVNNTVEWGTPVLYMRAPDGVLFSITQKPAAEETPPPAPRPVATPLVIPPAESTRMPNTAASKPQSPRTLRVFLCHASDDKPAVRALYQRLRAEGIDPWLDEEKLLPGQDWRREIQKAVRSSDIVIVCLSRRSITKTGYVQKEIKDALDVADEQPNGTIFLVPLKLEECNIPERLRRWQWVNFFEERGYERLMRALQARAEMIGVTITPSKKGRPCSTLSSGSKGVLIKASGPEIYLLKDGVRHWVPDGPTLIRLRKEFGDVKLITDSELHSYSQGKDLPSLSPRIVKSSGGEWFLLLDERRRQILGQETLMVLGGDPSMIPVISDEELLRHKEGKAITEQVGLVALQSEPWLAKSWLPEVYLVRGVIKRWVTDPSSLQRLMIQHNLQGIKRVDESEIEGYIEGLPVGQITVPLL